MFRLAARPDRCHFTATPGHAVAGAGRVDQIGLPSIPSTSCCKHTAARADRLMSDTNSPEPRLDYVMCASPSGTHRMAYWEWGRPDNDKVLLCVHGLTRCGRDFDDLARRMAPHYRVVCPDLAGRGKSDWLLNPAGYAVPQYAADMLTLIARLAPARLDWVGTSLGGLIALGLAGALAMSAAQRPDRGEFGLPRDATLPLGKIVLNDIGPRLDPGGMGRFADYVGKGAVFDRFEDAVTYVQSVSEGFGPHTQAQWQRLTRNVFNQQGGQWIKHYDLRIAEPMALQDEAMLKAAELTLWAAYDSLRTPVLLLRGQRSDLLTADTAREMLARNTHARLVEFAQVGHAPTLMSDEQIDPVQRFLLEASP